ncbi:hypothetical protein MNR01_14050 [Lysobacter sp. S4-A87]|uniref:hypothetical protein n=1 Tax=Lysobacter sp. S4-A87 TaxID=2925843 RepID=UPI001F530899|nr:hypothetical protein [Lysobacter sp. S4-A87]UNK48852.1 hypothetical protein MNR01_14050 [Lysobacter sp. S4-A87]
MKIEDITGNNLGSSMRGNYASSATVNGYNTKRNAAHPEVAELLNARLANMLFNCRSLARDEIELAKFIINTLDLDPHYIPSDTLLQAIRSINNRLTGNNKLAGDSPLHGIVRTA